MKNPYFISMSLTILSNVAYHFFQKQISPNANPLISLMVTYLVGLFVTAMCLPIFYPGFQLFTELKQLNWASYALGLGIVGLELGFLLAYRSGWNLSLAALYSNVAVTLVLLPIGFIFLNEQLTLKQLLGLALGLSGLLLLKR